MEWLSFDFLLGVYISVFLLVVMVIILYRQLIKKVAPNQACIVFGRRGTRIVVGGATFVNPFSEKYRILSLELSSLALSPAELFTAQGIGIQVNGVAHIRVLSEDLVCIRNAAEQFLDMSEADQVHLTQQIMEGHLRHVVGKLKVEDLVKNTDYVVQEMRKSVHEDLQKIGMILVSFAILQVRTSTDYIENLGELAAEELRRQIEISTAHAQRDIELAQIQASREVRTAKAQAEEESAQCECSLQKKQASLTQELSVLQWEGETSTGMLALTTGGMQEEKEWSAALPGEEQVIDVRIQ